MKINKKLGVMTYIYSYNRVSFIDCFVFKEYGEVCAMHANFYMPFWQVWELNFMFDNNYLERAGPHSYHSHGEINNIMCIYRYIVDLLILLVCMHACMHIYASQ